MWHGTPEFSLSNRIIERNRVVREKTICLNITTLKSNFLYRYEIILTTASSKFLIYLFIYVTIDFQKQFLRIPTNSNARELYIYLVLLQMFTVYLICHIIYLHLQDFIKFRRIKLTFKP